MTLDNLDAASEAADLARTPLKFELSGPRLQSMTRVVLLLPLLLLTAAPLMLVAAQAVAEPAVVAAVSDRPLAALLIVTGLLSSLLLGLAPFASAVYRATNHRMIEIDGHRVTITERSLIGTSNWSAPLAEFTGVAHRLRTTLSGARHELVLAHADPARHVVIGVSETPPSAALDKICKLLGLTEIPVRSLYVSTNSRHRGAAPVLAAEAVPKAA